VSYRVKFVDVALGDCCEIISGSTPSRLISEYWNGDINWFTPKDLSGIKSKYVTASPEQITQSGINSCSAKLLPPKSLLLSSRAPIGHIAISTIEACTNQGFKSLVPNENVDVEYLFYAIKKIIPQLQDLGNGATFKEISKATLSRVTIPLPPLAEQQKIASILDAADSLRQKDQQLIKKYTALSQSLFLEMFGDPVTNPMGWKMGTSIQYCKCIVPGRDKPKNFSGEIPWVTTNDLNRLTYTDKSKKNIGLTDEEIVEVRAKIIPVNSVILTCVGDLGVISINSSPVVINQQLHSFQCDNINISPIFMMYVLSYQTPYMYKMASSTTVPYMNKTVCNNIPMIYPPITLQTQFAERIQAIEAQKQIAQASLQKSENLFNSLLQRAFKGELTT
jgi:type I restriction enzyme S subunit